MRVTRLEKRPGKRRDVYLEDEYAFFLYPREIRQYGVEEGTELSESSYQEIMEEIIVRRARQKAMSLLERADRTEEELRQKLRMAGYPPYAADKAIAYVKGFGYVDDDRYLESYLLAREGSRSRRRMEADLRQKGLPKEKIRRKMEESGVTDEDAIREAMRKRAGRSDFLPTTPEEQRKLAAYLYRQGFQEADIRRHLPDLWP